jgi:hypothetical protein
MPASENPKSAFVFNVLPRLVNKKNEFSNTNKGKRKSNIPAHEIVMLGNEGKVFGFAARYSQNTQRLFDLSGFKVKTYDQIRKNAQPPFIAGQDDDRYIVWDRASFFKMLANPPEGTQINLDPAAEFYLRNLLEAPFYSLGHKPFRFSSDGHLQITGWKGFERFCGYMGSILHHNELPIIVEPGKQGGPRCLLLPWTDKQDVIASLEGQNVKELEGTFYQSLAKDPTGTLDSGSKVFLGKLYERRIAIIPMPNEGESWADTDLENAVAAALGCLKKSGKSAPRITRERLDGNPDADREFRLRERSSPEEDIERRTPAIHERIHIDDLGQLLEISENFKPLDQIHKKLSKAFLAVANPDAETLTETFEHNGSYFHLSGNTTDPRERS